MINESDREIMDDLNQRHLYENVEGSSETYHNETLRRNEPYRNFVLRETKIRPRTQYQSQQEIPQCFYRDYEELSRQHLSERRSFENSSNADEDVLQSRFQELQEESDESNDDETLISLGARRQVNSRTESLLVRMEAKSRELRSKIEFCYNSTIIEDQMLSTYTDSEILDTQKMNSVMLKQAEKLQEINHATNETFIRTMKFLTR